MIRFITGLVISLCWLHTIHSFAQYQTAPAEHHGIIGFIPDSIRVEGDLNGFKIDLSARMIEPGLDIITITMHRDEPATPPNFILKWRFPSVDIHKYWNPNYPVDRVNYYDNNIISSSTRLAPVICYMDQDDRNRFTFALADALNKISISTELIEEDACFHCGISFFTEKYPVTDRYSTELLIDRRENPFYKTLAEVANWWASHNNYHPAQAPEGAKRPMYSTWYSYHQQLNAKEIIAECREGKKLGLTAVIVDDGWQTQDSKRGYAYTGDWKPERIPDMKGFVDSIHALDMKFILWYSVPFIGKRAGNYNRFLGKYLYSWESQGAFVLDPRYPDVREFIIKTYEQAITEWNLDGLKLDFMDFFTTKPETILTTGDGRDYASVNDAVDRLMTDIMYRLKSKNPEVMIEFRQSYTGPLMHKYGNMFRAGDCPNMAVVNKVRVTDIRLLGGRSAVHSDMLMWHHDDRVENAALQILNVIFSVPQISVKLNEIPKEHKKMISFWIGYWNANRDVLIDGNFEPRAPDALYPLISASNSRKTITAIYNDVFVKNDFISPPAALDIINARKNTEVVMVNSKDFGMYDYEIYDCQGRIVKTGGIALKEGTLQFHVPSSGLVKLVHQ